MAKKAASKRRSKRNANRSALNPLVGGDGQPIYTVIYVHGIGNKPIQSVLKCQWDRALFGIEMGDRSRLAYWVDRERHPEPTAGNCGGGDLIDPDVEVAAHNLGAKSASKALEDEIDAEIESMAQSKQQAALLRALAKKIDRELAGHAHTARGRIRDMPRRRRAGRAERQTQKRGAKQSKSAQAAHSSRSPR
jgi:hypothetical protein